MKSQCLLPLLFSSTVKLGIITYDHRFSYQKFICNFKRAMNIPEICEMLRKQEEKSSRYLSGTGSYMFLYKLLRRSNRLLMLQFPCCQLSSSPLSSVFFFLFRTHSVRRYSICPFIERKSSSAQAAISLYNFFDRRSGICFFVSLILIQTTAV